MSEKENLPFSIPHVAIRLVETGEPLYSKEPLSSPKKVVAALKEMLGSYDRETLMVVQLRSNLTPISMHIASIGSLTSSLFHPREVLKAAVLENAYGIMLVHNHPSGNLTPSANDTQVTDQLQKACDIMGIELVDHIIVGPYTKEYFSFREQKLLSIKEPEYEMDYRNIHLAAGKDPMVSERGSLYQTGDRKDKIKEITEKLEQGLKDFVSSDTYKVYLTTMSKFHQYSLNNTILIAMQKPDATYVAGYRAWETKFDRHVKAGETGIKILAPAPYKKKVERDKVNKDTGQPVLDRFGNPEKEEVEITVPAYRPVSVFDIGQTDGRELPTLGVDELSFTVEGYEDFLQALKSISPVPISFENIDTGAKGYFSLEEQKIVVKKGMSEAQTIKTILHEICHSLIDDEDHIRIEGIDTKKRSRSDKEVTAESTAFTVASAFKMDVSEYSFGYISSWSNGKDLKELRANMEIIRKTADKMITDISDALLEIRHEREKLEEKVTLSVFESAINGTIGMHVGGIRSAEAAAKQYEMMAPGNMMEKVIGMHLPGKEEKDTVELDIFVKDTFDLENLTMVNGIQKNATAMELLAGLIHHFPDAKIIGNMPELLVEKLHVLRSQVPEKQEQIQPSVETKPTVQEPAAKAPIVADQPAKRGSLRAKLREKQQLVAAKPETAVKERGGILAK